MNPRPGAAHDRFRAAADQGRSQGAEEVEIRLIFLAQFYFGVGLPGFTFWYGDLTNIAPLANGGGAMKKTSFKRLLARVGSDLSAEQHIELRDYLERIEGDRTTDIALGARTRDVASARGVRVAAPAVP